MKLGKKTHKLKPGQQGLSGYFAKQKPKQKVIVLNMRISETLMDVSIHEANHDGWETDNDGEGTYLSLSFEF